MKYITITSFCFLLLSITSCKSNKKTTEAEPVHQAEMTKRSGQQSREKPNQRSGQPPSIDEMFKMDINTDGLLAKTEVKGRLLRDFDIIDTDRDGFISRKELENAPKPERGQRPPRNQ